VVILRVGQTWNDLFWHDQNMHGRLRIDVVKSDGILILPNDFCWDLSCDNFLENGHEILMVLIASELIPLNLRILTVIQTGNLEPYSSMGVNARNNSIAENESPLLIFRGRSRQFPRAAHHRRASTFSHRGGASRKVEANKVEDYRHGWQPRRRFVFPKDQKTRAHNLRRHAAQYRATKWKSAAAKAQSAAQFPCSRSRLEHSARFVTIG